MSMFFDKTKDELSFSKMSVQLPQSEESSSEILCLRKDGWKFEDEYWTSARDGRSYCNIKFKSPAMKKWGLVAKEEWPTITKDRLFRLEVTYISIELLHKMFHPSGVVNKSIANAIEKAISNVDSRAWIDNTNEFSNVKVDAKVFSNTKGINKLKVTMEFC